MTPAAAPRNHVQASACGCGPPPEECIQDNEILTQFGPKAGKFRNQPRIERELGLSVLVGTWTPEEALRFVLPPGQVPTRGQLNAAVVRLTTAGELRKAGFAVVHTPGRVKPKRHASVVWPQADPLVGPVVPWPAAVSEKFDSCFNEGREGEHDEP